MKHWWRRWTYEVPLAIGDALWEVLVVQLAALLDRVTVRKVIAFIPVVILIAAYYHSIPIPPELMLVGDFLAYIDIFSVLFLVGVLSRITTILFVVRQASERIVSSPAASLDACSGAMPAIGASVGLQRDLASPTSPRTIELMAACGARPRWPDPARTSVERSSCLDLSGAMRVEVAYRYRVSSALNCP